MKADLCYANKIANMKRFLLISLAIALLSACAYVPAAKPQAESYGDCQMYTKELELKEEELVAGGGACQGPACVAVAIVPAASFVISGTVVLIGNTLHWMEKHGTCRDREVKQDVEDYQDWAIQSGGQTIR